MDDIARSVMPGEPIDDDMLVTLLEQENRSAIGYLSDQVSQDQDDNLERYLGMPYGDEEDGASNVISHDVAEVVDWALPDLLEPFLAGDRIVEFDPNSREDEKFCEQATDLATHVFFVDNPGVIILHDVAKSAMIQKIGVIKTYWHDEQCEEDGEAKGLDQIAFAQLAEDPSVEIIESSERVIELSEDIAPAFPTGMAIDVKYKTIKDKSKVCVVAVPPEEFKVRQRASSIEKPGYCCHETRKTRADLIAMGFDADLVMRAASHETSDEDTRRDTRFWDQSRRDEEGGPKLSDELLLLEEYYDCDLDGDGREKLVQAFRVGKTLLSREEVEENPFDMWSPDRIPHRLIGQGLADKVKQTQRVKTVLTRQMLDNVYLANNPRMEVPETAISENTLSDLLEYRIGGLIRTKQSGQMRSIEVPDRSSVALQAISYMDSVREMQSGIVRNGQAISSEEIDPKSATESRRQDRNSQVRKRLMARMFAETLLVPVFRKVLRLLVKYQDAPRTLKVSGEWVTMDPRGWNAELRARVYTGLGHSSKDEELQASQLMLGIQAKGREVGLVTEAHLWATAKKFVSALGWHNPEDYFMNPESEQGQQMLQARAQQQPPEDPKVIEAKGRIELKQQEAVVSTQLAEAKAQHEKELAERNAQHREELEAYKLETDRIVAELRAENEMSVAASRMEVEERIAMYKSEKEFELAKWKMEMTGSAQIAEVDSIGASYRPGGDLDK